LSRDFIPLALVDNAARNAGEKWVIRGGLSKGISPPPQKKGEQGGSQASQCTQSNNQRKRVTTAQENHPKPAF